MNSNKNFMNNLKLLIITIICLIANIILGQSYINVQGHFNYWKHTEVFGPGIGLGYSYKYKNLNLAINYDYGYGAINRLKNIENINYNNWSTIFIKEQKGKWNEFLGYTEKLSNELKGSSDYGKQHQISFQIGCSIVRKKDVELVFSSGIYTAFVEHFYTFTNIPVYNIELPSVYSGPLNYIPATSQKIYTYGINFEIALNKFIKSKIISPYIIGGLGPKYGSYLSFGVRMSTILIKN